MNGEEVHNLTLLGKVVKANVSATTQEYVIDDGTGTVNVKRWVDAEDEAAKGAVEAKAVDLILQPSPVGHHAAFEA